MNEKIYNFKKNNFICDAILLQYKLNKFKNAKNMNLVLNLNNYKIKKKIINKTKNINVLIKNKNKLYLKKNYVLKNKNSILLNNSLMYYWVYNKIFKTIFKLFLLTYIYYVFLIKLLNNLPLNLSNLFNNTIFLNNYLNLFKNMMLINKKKKLFSFNYNNSYIFPVINKYNKLKRKWLKRYLNILLIKHLKYKISNTISKYYNKHIIPCIFFLSKKKLILDNTKQILDFIRFNLQKQKKQIYTLKNFFYIQKLNFVRKKRLLNKIKKKIKYCKNKFYIYFKNKIKKLILFFNKNNININNFLIKNSIKNKYIFNHKNNNNFEKNSVKNKKFKKKLNNSILRKYLNLKYKNKIKKMFFHKNKFNLKKYLNKLNLTNLNFKKILNLISKKKNIYLKKYNLLNNKIVLYKILLKKYILKYKSNLSFKIINFDTNIFFLNLKKKIFKFKKKISVANLIKKQLFIINKKCSKFFIFLLKFRNKLQLVDVIKEKKNYEMLVIKIKNQLKYFINLTNLKSKKLKQKFNNLNKIFLFNNLNLFKLYLSGLNELINRITIKKKMLITSVDKKFSTKNIIDKNILLTINDIEKDKFDIEKKMKIKKIYRKYRRLIYSSERKFPLIGIRIELNGNIKKGTRSKKFNYLDLAKIYITKIPIKDTRYHTEYVQSYARTKKCAIGIKIWIYYKRKVKKLLNIYKKKSINAFNMYQVQKNKKILKKNKKIK